MQSSFDVAIFQLLVALQQWSSGSWCLYWLQGKGNWVLSWFPVLAGLI